MADYLVAQKVSQKVVDSVWTLGHQMADKTDDSTDVRTVAVTVVKKGALSVTNSGETMDGQKAQLLVECWVDL